jgi:transcriptional regulator with XRE-family HTH domain
MTVQEQRPCKGRTVKPNGNRIRELRTAKGWNVAETAARVGCGKRTVELLEAGRCCYVFTLDNFAKALGVTPKEIIEGQGPDPLPEGKRMQVQIKLSIPFAEFDESKALVDFLEALKKLINSKDDIDPTSVEEGSVIITLEVSPRDALEISRLLHMYDLKELPIDAVQAFGGPWMTRDEVAKDIEELKRRMPLPGETRDEGTHDEDAQDDKKTG